MGRFASKSGGTSGPSKSVVTTTAVVGGVLALFLVLQVVEVDMSRVHQPIKAHIARVSLNLATSLGANSTALAAPAAAVDGQAGVAADSPGEQQPQEQQPQDQQPQQPAEEPKPEELKPEELKPAEPKPEEPKPEEPKPEELKPAEPNPEEPKPAESNPEEPKPAEPNPEEPKPAEPKPEEPKPAEHQQPKPAAAGDDPFAGPTLDLSKLPSIFNLLTDHAEENSWQKKVEL